MGLALPLFGVCVKTSWAALSNNKVFYNCPNNAKSISADRGILGMCLGRAYFDRAPELLKNGKKGSVRRAEEAWLRVSHHITRPDQVLGKKSSIGRAKEDCPSTCCQM